MKRSDRDRMNRQAAKLSEAAVEIHRLRLKVARLTRERDRLQRTVDEMREKDWGIFIWED